MAKNIEKTVIGGTAWIFFSKVLTVLIGLVLTAFLTRLLSKEELGAYYLSMTVLSVLGLLSQAGMANLIVRHISSQGGGQIEDRSSPKIMTALVLSTLISLVLVVLTQFGGGEYLAIRVFDSNELHRVIGLISVTAIPVGLVSLMVEACRGRKNYKMTAIFSTQPQSGGVFVSAFIVLFLFLKLALSEKLGLYDVILINLAAWIVALVCLSKNLFELQVWSNLKFNGLEFWGVLREAFPLFVSGLTFFALGQADIWVVGHYLDDKSVGEYGVAAALVRYVSAFNLLMSAVLPPVISELYEKGELEKLEKLLGATALIGLVPAVLIFVLLLLFGGTLIDFAFGSAYSGVLPLVLAMSVGHVVNAATGNCGMVLIMTGRQGTMMYISVISSVILIASEAVAAMKWGLFGVAVAAGVGLAFQNTLMWYFARKQVGVWTHASIRNYSDILYLLRSRWLKKS